MTHIAQSHSKAEALRRLAAIRQRCPYDGYANIGCFHCGAYECDHVSPYTKSANNYDSSIFVMLQDWLSQAAISRKLKPAIRDHGRNPALQTNRVLDSLLARHFGLSLHEIYATNLFPFIKPGGMSAAIHRDALRRAASQFALPQIDIVSPRLVIVLGLVAFNALRYVIRSEEVPDVDAAISAPISYGGAQIWCQAHTGYWGQLNRRRLDPTQPHIDWTHMSSWHALSP